MTHPTSTTPEGIAIVGLAGRFPGARDAQEFWRNLAAGRDGITRFTDEELAATGYDAAKLRELDGYVAARGVIEKPEWFDRSFFNIPPKEAEVMDPQHRVFMEVAWAALEDAACDPSRYAGLIGVFAGMSNNTYYPFFVRQRRDLLDAVGIVSAVIANEKDFLTTRLAYKLDLRGPALNIQTACSSSLVTVCVACQNLLDHQCDVALAGGVSVTFPQDRGYFYQDGSMTSPDGWCRPFDERANGTVFSSGAGVVVLKRVADAMADGDHIYAVIKGHALNNDGGQKVGFAAPSVNGHTEVISLAQAVAGVSPDTISYIEAHGTATPLGDPVEIAGLTHVFREATDARQFCAVGSVKGNIGHCDAASGIASLIKMALAFQHSQLPPSLHCEQPNPALHLGDSPFFLNTTLRDWPRTEAPRRAGVSSFGVGGTNAHLVLEEAPPIAALAPAADEPQLLVLSAKSAAALDQRAQDLAADLETNCASLADIAFTLHEGRQPFGHRRAIVARTAAEAIAALRAPAKLHREDSRLDTTVAFLFPGQGSQYPGMGARLFAHEPVFRDTLAQCAEVLRPELGLDLCELLFSRDAAAAERLRETRFTQPAIFAVSFALARLWQSRGVEPVALVGHSVGEFVAAALAGVFSWEDAARLVALRARLTQELPRGAMLAARLGEEEAAEFLADSRLAIAAVNSPKLIVISGPFDAIETLEAKFTERSITARRLATSHAFHSPMVEPVVEPLGAALRAVKLSAPAIPIVSSVTGEWLTAAQATDPEYWAQHLRATVRFSAAAGRLLADRGCALLECGPGQTLSQLIRQNSARTAQHEVAHSIAEEVDESESIAAALGRLWLAGVPIDWRAAHPGREFRRIPLPTYPFERQRYFADLPAGVAMPIATAATDGEAPVLFVPQMDADETQMGKTHSLHLRPSASICGSSVETISADTALARVKQLLTDLSGIDLADRPGSTSLLDLGFDSLFLSQAALTMSRKWGVKVTVRQLLGDLGTLDALAAVMPAATTEPVAKPIAPTAAHGPFRPLQRDLGTTLTAPQQRWLGDFITRYGARTGASKRHTQENRAHFADPRAAAGFKQQWKEIVYPIVTDRSAGARLWDIDGNELLDLTLSFGAAMLGHQPPFVVEAIRDQLERGFEIGPTSPLAGEVAALLCELTGADRATFCNTGSEAVTGALRAARTVTGRTKIVYFRESYHGIDNEVLGRRAGQAVLPIAPGIPDAAVAETIILEYGDSQSLAAIAAQAADIAAVIVEPVQSRHPALQPRAFLHELRALTEQHGIALIFDEIISGFRCHLGGAQAFFGIRADLAAYGKVIGGGLPIGAIAGRAEFMDAFDGGAWQFGDDSFPGAAVTFFAGTFVRHPLALAAARAVLTHLKQSGGALQDTLAGRAGRMIDGIAAAFDGTPFTVQRFASNWLVLPAPEFKYSGLLFALLRHRGLHIWENRPCFVSTAHTDADLERVVTAFEESVAELESAGFFSRTKVDAQDGAMPITEAQQEIWVLCQQGQTASNSFNETWTLLLDGALDAAALRRGVQAIVDRHESLRSTFSHDGETITVAPALTIDVPLIDLVGDAERDTRFGALRAAEGTRIFDLERGPLVAIQLVRLAPEKHALVFNAHHLICDGWSCDVFLNELAALYSGTQPLPAPMAMRDYERFMHGLRETPEFAADSAYWREQYRTIPPALTLPGDRPYPRRRSFRGASEQIVLPAEFAQTLSRFGAQQGATLFSVLLAGYQALLFRLSGQGDLAVGVPSAGQNLAGGDHLIGHCVNMLPLRSQARGEQTFAEFLKAVQATVLDAFEHQRVTFGSLLRQLSFSREPGRVPLIPVTFNVDPPLSHIHFAGLQHRLEANPRSAFQFDLGFNCDTTAHGFRLICHYNTDLFDAATIQRWLGQYRALLESVAANPAQPLRALLPAPDSGETPVEFWPSSPSAGDDPEYDEVLYNAMTLDKSRHDSYRRAFVATVRGKLVVDIGTGRDALLARFCVEAGARKVYAIELLEAPARQARALIESLGLSDRIVVLHGRSQEVELPERVDVCVSENVGHIGGTEGCDLILDDARRRFLKPGGLIIPSRCETRVAAVCLPDGLVEKPVFDPLGAYYAEQIWQRAGYKHDFRLCLMGMSRAFLRSTDDVFEDVDFTQPPVPQYEREVRLTITCDSQIDGLLLWLRLETAPGETLEAIDHSDSWLPVYLPVFDPPIAVAAGDRIEAVVRGALAENGMNRDYHIAGRVVRAGGGTVEFAFDSWHYKEVYRHTPFYARLFSGDAIPSSRRSPIPTEGKGVERPFPANKGVHQLFETQAALTPDAVAVEAGAERVTYRELNARANRLARHLRTLGVERGSCVGVSLERSIDLISAFLAVVKAGGAYVPLDPAYPAERLALMVADTQAPVVLTERKLAANLPQTTTRIVEIDGLKPGGEESSNLDLPGGGEDRAYVMFTSGSTGTPKGVVVPHRAIARLVINADYAPLTAGDAVAFAANPSFDAATWEIWGPLLNGGRVVITPTEVLLSARALERHLAEHRITALFVTTALFDMIAHEAAGAFRSLRYLLFGGEKVNPESVRRVLAQGRPQMLLHVYGPTETTTFATFHRVESVEEDRVPIGRPIANTEVHLLNVQMETVPPGVTGEIYIGGPGLALGYLHAPELEAARFIHHPQLGRLYKTGDLARRLPDGAIEFVGRIDHQIKLRGFRIEPGEVETALRRLKGIGQCAVLAREVSPGDRRLIAYYTPNGAPPPPPAVLRCELERALPAYMVPSAFMEVSRFPLTSNGKLAVRELPLPAADAEHAAICLRTGDSLQAQLMEIWEELLGVGRIGINDDFFQVGGHSLLAVRMLTMIEQRLGRRISLAVLFEQATIANLARVLMDELRQSAADEPAIAIHSTAKRRPFFFMHGDWGGGGFFCRTLAAQIGPDRPFYAVHPHGLLGEAMPRTIAAMAAERLAYVRTLQPHGPYLLGGYCNGAYLAYEMARQLEAAGEQVDLLTLLMADGGNYRFRLWHWLARAASIWHPGAERRSDLLFIAWRRQRQLFTKWLHDRSASAGRFLRKPLAGKAQLLLEKLRRGHAQGGNATAPLAEAEDATTLAYHHAVDSFMPGPFGGRVLLLWPTEQATDNGGDPTEGWSATAREVQLIRVPGDHATCIQQHANLRVVGDELRRALDTTDPARPEPTPLAAIL